MALPLASRPRFSVVTVAGDRNTGSPEATLASLLESSQDSLRVQELDEWEWIVLVDSVDAWRPHRSDTRVRMVVDSGTTAGIEAKALAYALALGEIIIELGAGDRLVEGALQAISDAFGEDPDAGVAYSDCGASATTQGDPAAGETYEAEVDGRQVIATRSLDPLPHNVSHPAFTRGRLRAHRLNAYREAGGHDSSTGESGDHDLECRMFQNRAALHIERCLYMRDGSGTDGADVAWSRGPTAVYERHVETNAIAWARRHGLDALDLLPPIGVAAQPGYAGVDLEVGIADLVNLPESSVGVVRAVDFLPFVQDGEAFFGELHRLLAHGGMILSRTVASGWDEKAFRQLATDRNPPARFRVSRLRSLYPTEWHRERAVAYVLANLVAVKSGPFLAGPVEA